MKKSYALFAPLAGLVIVMLGACTDTDNSGLATSLPQIRVAVPKIVAQVKAIDQNEVYPTLTINNVTYSLNQEGNEWRGEFQVKKNSTHTVAINWFETFQGRALQLASISENVAVGSGAASLSFANTDYITESYDSDGDGLSNYDERVASPTSNPYLKSTIESAAVAVIPRLRPGVSPPVIDGEYSVDEWDGAVTEDKNNATLLINNLMRIDEGNDLNDGQPRSRWTAVHDGTYLYLAVLSDDNGNRQSGSANAWDDDNLNVYLDADYSHGNNYDGVNDYHMLIPLLDSNGNSNNSSSSSTLILQGVNSATLPPLRYFNSVAGSSESGAHGQSMDVYEVRINLASAKMEVGELIGLDTHLDDDDNGGDRDSKWGWYHPSRSGSNVDNTYQSPSYMAPVALEN